MNVSSNIFLDLLQSFERLNSCRMRRRMVISFSCESSRPSGPCMSSFCLSSLRWTLSSRTFLWLRIPLGRARVHERRSFFTTFSPTPNFLPNTRLQNVQVQILFSWKWFQPKNCRTLWIMITNWPDCELIFLWASVVQNISDISRIFSYCRLEMHIGNAFGDTLHGCPYISLFLYFQIADWECIWW